MNNLSKNLLNELQTIMHLVNPFVNSFKSARRSMDENNIPDIRLIMRAEKNTDLRRFNIPTASEVAVLMPGENDQLSTIRDIEIYKTGGGIRRINSLNPLYDPLHYVLLFPYGEFGFSLNIPYKKLKPIEKNDNNHGKLSLI